MNKKLLLVVMAVAVIFTLLGACSGSSSESKIPKGKYEILRKATLGGKWQMYQLRIDLPTQGEFDIDFLDLAEGDKVDGYFYPDKGTGISLEIKAGTTVVFKSEPSAGNVNSDRFSVAASQPKGTAYVLLFRNVGTDKEVSVFVEVIYPATAHIRGPLDLK